MRRANFEVTRECEPSVELEKIAVEFKKLADAAEPLYESLDDAQKRRFEPLLRKHVGLPQLTPYGA